ncbi:MAG TPA: GNAT family N-acetyltransferase [Thermomicrobiales bacterium]|nr:GNAT family N-acetyltransferase [Thermomicrobiales bacterium]
MPDLAARPATIAVRPLEPADADACDTIVLSLPYHFGDEGGRRECARAVREDDGLVAVAAGAVIGFLTVERHFAESAEITWLAVHADWRGRGAGRALVERLCADLRTERRRLLLVHTLGPSYDEGDVADGYAGTRAFYRALGFIPAREYTTLWPGNPALLLVRSLREEPA